ncbi:MAG TPA: putative quinol monooxygenase [Humisphaera sp.]
MYIVTVTVHVKPENVEQFKTAILDNARNTRKEPGNIRFDVVQGQDDPTKFILYEVYHRKEDFAAHQQTAHFFRWRDTVASFMAEPRTAIKGTPIFYGDAEV